MRLTVGKSSVLLGLIAALASAIIAVVYVATDDQIAAQERAAKARVLREIFPPGNHDNALVDDFLRLPAGELGQHSDRRIYLARNRGKVIGMIFPAIAADGYNGEISLIIGINRDGSIAGVRILSHAETPGLGDQVELKNSNWVLGFNGKSLQNPLPDRWKIKKDQGEFDQFTGATITPRAATKAILNTLRYYELHGARLLQLAEQPTRDDQGKTATRAE